MRQNPWPKKVVFSKKILGNHGEKTGWHAVDNFRPPKNIERHSNSIQKETGVFQGEFKKQ